MSKIVIYVCLIEFCDLKVKVGVLEECCGWRMGLIRIIIRRYMVYKFSTVVFNSPWGEMASRAMKFCSVLYLSQNQRPSRDYLPIKLVYFLHWRVSSRFTAADTIAARRLDHSVRERAAAVLKTSSPVQAPTKRSP